MADRRVPLIGTLANRDSSTDQDMRYVNCYPDRVGIRDDGKPRVFSVKRPGLAEAYTTTTAEGRGQLDWEGSLYSVIGNKVYKNGVALSEDLFSSTGRVYLTGTTGSTTYLAIHDGSDIWLIDTSDNMYLIAGGSRTYSDWAATTAYSLADRRVPTTKNGFFYEVTTAGTSGGTEPTWPVSVGGTVSDGTVTWTCTGYYTNLPSNMVSGFASLDGYLVVMDANADVYTSNVDDPTTWTSTDFINAELNPDDGVAVARHLNYITAFGEYTTEFFYNAANAVGSPLGRVEGAAYSYGCAAGDTVVVMQNMVFFVALTQEGAKSIYQFEGLSPKRISSSAIDRLLEGEGSALEDAYAFAANINGHWAYILQLSNKTLVYDMEGQMWTEWTSYNGVSETAFRCCAFSLKDYVGHMLDSSNGKIYTFDPTVYQDDGEDILVTMVTDLYDFGNIRRKFLYRIDVIGDRQAASSPVSISWTDDNYVTYTSARSVDLSSRAYLTRLGQFERRAFKLVHQANTPLRLEALDLYFTLSPGAVS